MLWSWLVVVQILLVAVLSDVLVEPDELILNTTYTTLTVKKCEWNIANVVTLTTRCYCYQWKGTEKCTIPGPTLVFTNGSNGYVNISNKLIGDDAYPLKDVIEDLVSHDPDVTNLHTHGLHVDPAVDDVVDIFINPGYYQHYPFFIPSDHYPGLHWYHAHWHGSVTFQVHGGLIGALLVNRENNKGLDASFVNMKTKLLVLHSVHLSNDTNRYLLNGDGTCNCTNYTDWFDVGDAHSSVSLTLFHLTTVCDEWCDMLCVQRHHSATEPRQVFNKSNNNDIFINVVQADGVTFDHGMSAFLVNGQYQPTINIETNEWLRLRILNADAQGSYLLHFEQNSGCEYHYIGADGIFFDSPRNMSMIPYQYQVYVSMAGRVEVVLRCSNSGLFTVKHVANHSNQTINNNFVQRNPIYKTNITMFYLNVTSNISSVPSPFNISSVTFPPKVGYIADTLNETYSNFANCPNYSSPNGTVNSTIMWSVGPSPSNDECTKASLNVPFHEYGINITLNLTGKVFGMNGQYFRHDFPLALLMKDEVYEMIIGFGPHPFHHHINPYQLTRDIGYGFLGMKGEWRDIVSSGGDAPFNARTRTADFTGKIVMHCHFLPHEDRGLMSYYKIINFTTGCNGGEGIPLEGDKNCNVPRGNDELCEILSEFNMTTTEAATTTQHSSNANTIRIIYSFYLVIFWLIFIMF